MWLRISWQRQSINLNASCFKVTCASSADDMVWYVHVPYTLPLVLLVKLYHPAARQSDSEAAISLINLSHDASPSLHQTYRRATSPTIISFLNLVATSSLLRYLNPSHLHNELERQRGVGIRADDRDDVDVGYAHVEAGAVAHYADRHEASLLGLKHVHAERIHHVAPVQAPRCA